METLNTPRIGSCRIVKADDHNYAVERYVEVAVTEKKDGKREKTGEKRYEWQECGYFGHRLDWAAESAIFKSHPTGEVTPQTLRQCVREVVENCKGVK